ncbi:hypothetical protein ACFLZX_04725 [Nanoarchaeota archaeon]
MHKETKYYANPEYKRWWRGMHWRGPVKSGIGFGVALAIVLSYTKNNSILWAIIHGILSWLYVIYRAILEVGWF